MKKARFSHKMKMIILTEKKPVLIAKQAVNVKYSPAMFEY
jgi:hypothetical protein